MRRCAYDELATRCKATASELSLDVEVRQTGDEADFIGWLHAAAGDQMPVVLTPGAFTY